MTTTTYDSSVRARSRQAGWALFGAGVCLLLMLAVNVHTPLRAFLALGFFLAGPGTALLPHLRVEDRALAASLAIGLSVVATVAVAQTMVWLHVFSPTAAVVVLLAAMAVALTVQGRKR